MSEKMTREERKNVLHCLKVMAEEEVCEECDLYGTTGTDHCEKDCVRMAIQALSQEPCDKAVSREDKKHIDGFKYWCETNEENGTITIPKFVCDEIVKILDELPPVTPKSETVTEFADRCRECGKRYVKRQTGHWIYKQKVDLSVCSKCGAYSPHDKYGRIETDFCPNCGCRMVEPQESEDK